MGWLTENRKGMKNALRVLIFFGLLLKSFTSQAQDLTVNAPPFAEKGQVFNVRYVLTLNNDDNPKFSIDKNAGFEIFRISSSTSSSTSIQIINGRMTTSQTYTYAWIVPMKTEKTGTLTLPKASVTLSNGKKLTFDPPQIVIGTQANNPLPQPQKTNPQKPSNTPKNLPNKNIFLSLYANKKSVYIGEPIYLTLTLYSVKRIADLTDYKPGNITGFWSYDLMKSKNVSQNITELNGKQYFSVNLEKLLLIPQKTGELTIGSYFVNVEIDASSFFNPFATRDVKLHSNSLTITVKPLPQENKPANFTGAVGDFNISLQIDKDTFNIDEPVVFSVVISGKGNFGLFDKPAINMPHVFDPIQPTETQNLKYSPEGITGSIVYKFSYIPRVPGTYSVQPVTFSYFNPEDKKYYTLKTQPLKITITGTIDSTAYGRNIQQARQLAKDIHYIRTKKFKLSKKDNYLIANDFYWLSYIILTLLTLAVIYWQRERIKLAADIRRKRFKDADKISRKYLKQAEKLLKQNKIQEFYQAVDYALNSYVSNKLDIPRSNLTLENVKQKLSTIDPQIAEEFTKIIEECQKARFSPVATLQPKELFEKAKTLISQIEAKF